MSERHPNTPIDQRLLELAAHCLDDQTVQALSNLELDSQDRTRLSNLAEKANEGILTPDEEREYDRFIELSDIITTLRLKADQRLKSSAA